MATLAALRRALREAILRTAGPEPIRGFHVSPHMFEAVEGAPFGRFDSSKMGTGEGAQAFGWGHYIAGNPATREDYAKQFGLRGSTFRGRQLSERYADVGPDDVGQREHNRARHLFGGYTSIEEAFAAQRNAIKRYEAENAPAIVAEERAILDEMDRLAPEIQLGNVHRYDVELPIGQNALLDWDAPLSQQPTLREAVSNLELANPYRIFDEGARFNIEGPMGPVYHKGRGPKTREEAEEAARDMLGGFFGPDPTGETVYRGMVKRHYNDPQAASLALAERGIPGIRYLDGGSRRAGEGTHNYVIFFDDLPRITRRYGIPVAAGAGSTELLRRALAQRMQEDA